MCINYIVWIGGITVGLVNDQNSVLMLSPWTARDLNIRCLADRIHDIDVLRCVYPSNRSRDDAFGEFYTQRMGKGGIEKEYSTLLSHSCASFYPINYNTRFLLHYFRRDNETWRLCYEYDKGPCSCHRE